MLPSERIRELEIQIHNQQPHLDRVVVCLRAVATYLDEDYNTRKECSECKHPEGYQNSHYPTCPLINQQAKLDLNTRHLCAECGFQLHAHAGDCSHSQTKPPSLPSIVFPALPLKPEDKK